MSAPSKDIDTNSRTWKAVSAWAEQRLDSSRQRIEAAGYPQAETEFERGRIAALREILKLPDPPSIDAAGIAAEHVD